jgi:hypothetical protein
MPTHQDLSHINHEIAERERKTERSLMPFGVVVAILAIGFVASLISLLR